MPRRHFLVLRSPPGSTVTTHRCVRQVCVRAPLHQACDHSGFGLWLQPDVQISQRSGGTTPKPVVTFRITPTAWDALSTAGGTTPKQVVTHYGDHSDCRGRPLRRRDLSAHAITTYKHVGVFLLVPPGYPPPLLPSFLFLFSPLFYFAGNIWKCLKKKRKENWAITKC